MIRLAEFRDGNPPSVLPPGRDLVYWHQALSAEIAAHLTSAHAAILAVPVLAEGSITWLAPGSAMRRLRDLPEDDRQRLHTATGVILSDIRRLAESGRAPVVSEAWPGLCSVPDLTHVFAVDGRPVLTGWGFTARSGSASPLAAWDDGVPWCPTPRTVWWIYAVSLVTLGALALGAGLVSPLLAGLLPPTDSVCRAPSRQLALMQDTAREADLTAMLKEALAQLQEDHGTRALQCPVPRVAEPLAPPPPALARPSAPTARQAQVCVGEWPIGRWIQVTDRANGLAPETIHLPFDPAVTLPTWTSNYTRFTRCGEFVQQRSISTRQGRLADGRSVILNSVIASGQDGSQICYEYWDAYRRDDRGWVRDAVKLEAVVLRTSQGVAVAGSPTGYCMSSTPSQR